MIRLIKLSLLIFCFASTLLASSQSTRVEKDEYGEMKIPSGAYYGMNVARAMKHLNISNESLADYPAFVKALAFVKLAAIEVNSDNDVLNQDKSMMLNRACWAIINGGHIESFQFELYNGSQGYLENAAINEVLANLAIEMSGANKGNYKVINPILDANLNQNYQSVYQSALNLAIVTQNEALLKEIEILEKALASFPSATSNTNRANSATPISIQAVQSSFEKHKDSLSVHIANLQMSIVNLKFHTENGSERFEDIGKTEFSAQFSNALLTATGISFKFQNPVSKLDNHLEYITTYAEALGEMNDFLISTCKLIQALNTRASEGDPFSFSNINQDNGAPQWGHIIPGTVIENCMQITGRLWAVQNMVESKKQKSTNDVNLVGLEVMVSQQQLTRSIKSLRKNYLD